jgi:hypothetical protein
MKKQYELMEKAKAMIDRDEDCTILFGEVETEFQLRIKHYVLNLPEDKAKKTIYGRSVWSSRENVPRSRGRPKK